MLNIGILLDSSKGSSQANVARYHRRSVPKKRHDGYWMLKPTVRSRIKKLSALLGAADGLDRSRFQDAKNIPVQVSPNEISLSTDTIDEPLLEIP